jgi:hypothetical protein
VISTPYGVNFELSTGPQGNMSAQDIFANFGTEENLDAIVSGMETTFSRLKDQHYSKDGIDVDLKVENPGTEDAVGNLTVSFVNDEDEVEQVNLEAMMYEYDKDFLYLTERTYSVLEGEYELTDATKEVWDDIIEMFLPSNMFAYDETGYVMMNYAPEYYAGLFGSIMKGFAELQAVGEIKNVNDAIDTLMATAENYPIDWGDYDLNMFNAGNKKVVAGLDYVDDEFIALENTFEADDADALCNSFGKIYGLKLSKEVDVIMWHIFDAVVSNGIMAGDGAEYGMILAVDRLPN